MAKRDTDFADGLYRDDATETAIPKNEDGSWRVAVFTEPAKTSAELEERERHMRENPIDAEFINADGMPEILPLTPAERAHFTPEELAELDALTEKRNTP